jgi:hypothetical protein
MIHVLTTRYQGSRARIQIKKIEFLKTSGIPLRYIVADGTGDKSVNAAVIRISALTHFSRNCLTLANYEDCLSSC